MTTTHTVDWEFPKDRREAKAYVDLLRTVRQELDAYGQRATPSQPHYLLTVAAPCGQEQLSVMDLRGMDAVLDYWHLMAYDFSGSWTPVAAHQANLLGKAPSASAAVQAYLSAGIAPSKIVLGIPLYGRGFDGTSGPNQPYASISARDEGVFSYKELPPPGAQESFSPNDGASWSFDGQQLVSYDSPEAARAKARYIRERGLGGAMFWELSGDHPPSHARSLVRCTADEVCSWTDPACASRLYA